MKRGGSEKSGAWRSSREKRPEETDLLGQGDAERGADGGDGVPEGDAVDDVVGEEAGVLQGEGAVAHHQLPHLLSTLVQDGTGAEVYFPLPDASGLHRRVQVPHLHTRVDLLLFQAWFFFLLLRRRRRRYGALGDWVGARMEGPMPVPVRAGNGGRERGGRDGEGLWEGDESAGGDGCYGISDCMGTKAEHRHLRRWVARSKQKREKREGDGFAMLSRARRRPLDCQPGGNGF